MPQLRQGNRVSSIASLALQLEGLRVSKTSTCVTMFSSGIAVALNCNLSLGCKCDTLHIRASLTNTLLPRGTNARHSSSKAAKVRWSSQPFKAGNSKNGERKRSGQHWQCCLLRGKFLYSVDFQPVNSYRSGQQISLECALQL